MLTENFKEYILYEKNTVITNIKNYYEEDTHYHVVLTEFRKLKIEKICSRLGIK